MRDEAARSLGLDWRETGQAALSGPLLQAYRGLDRLFLRWAAEWSAEEHRFPVFIPARELQKLDYFSSFPHLVTFPVTLDADPENLRAFAEGPVLDGEGGVRLTAAAPIHEVLTPAACYHFYVRFQGRAFEAPAYLTTVATCFRREAFYRPLARQWSFTMREVVCLGTAEEAKGFLSAFEERLRGFFGAVGLPVEFRPATDPFFNPSRNPKFLAQRLDPVKTEIVFGDDLAIGSLNFHRNFFGETFSILRGGEPAFSACVAFGLERWLLALLERFGTEPSSWPEAFRPGA